MEIRSKNGASCRWLHQSDQRIIWHIMLSSFVIILQTCYKRYASVGPRARNPRFYFVHTGTKPGFMTKKGHQKSGIPCSDSVLWSDQRIIWHSMLSSFVIILQTCYKKIASVGPTHHMALQSAVGNSPLFWNTSPFQTFTPQFQPGFVVDSFDELSEMEIRSKKGVSCRQLIAMLSSFVQKMIALQCNVSILDALIFCNKFAR
jgi:hypothetical protein